MRYAQQTKLDLTMYIERKLKNIPSKLTRLLKYFSQTKGKVPLHADHKTAVITFSDRILNKDMGRYSFILSQVFKFSGFEPVLRVNEGFFADDAPYKKMLLDQGFKLVRNTEEEEDTVVLQEGGKRKKLIKFSYGYALIRHKIDGYYMPYTLHPRFYQGYLKASDFAIFRRQRRCARIIFAGNFERKLYNKSVLKEKFAGTISRVEVLDHIDANYAEDPAILRSGSKEHLYGLLSAETARQKFIISEARTPDDDWLSILSKSDFYLCLPGVRMPWSHNAFEAMAVGTIPILQYHELFYPPLEHLKNCIAYTSYESLDEAIQCALAMSQEQIQTMKASVIQYFDTNLATERTVDKIESFFHSEADSMCIALPFLE